MPCTARKERFRCAVDESAGHGGDRQLAGIPSISGADDPDESRNDLARVAAKYARSRP